MSPLAAALITAISVGTACSVLSVFVVAKRWAFIGEGIAHAGFGGAGTAWMMALLFPAIPAFTGEGFVYAVSTVCCLAVAMLVASLTHRSRAAVDTTVGIFLVASLAWGFIAYRLYAQRLGHMPAQFEQYLGFSPLREISGAFALSAVAVSAAVCGAAGLFWKELLFYATDERQAEASGVRVTLIHYGLILLLALVIMVGMRLMGSVLVVALLVLPGAIGLMLGQRTGSAWGVSVGAGLAGAVAGPLINARYAYIPEGPAIVLTLFVLFVAALAGRRWMVAGGR